MEKFDGIALNLVPATQTKKANTLPGENDSLTPVASFMPLLNNIPPLASVGASDLDPFNGTVFPRLGPTISRPEGGNYVGPDHPIFQQGPLGPNHGSFPDPDGFFPDSPFLPPGFDAPQPRFDPFGPVVGPHRDIDFGVQGRGRGRGRGQFPNSIFFPGEPNPDHLKPPGW